MEHTSYGATATAQERLAWLREQAAQLLADNPAAVDRWLETPRRDLAGFTPAQCAQLGGAPLQRAAWVLQRRCVVESGPVLYAALSRAGFGGGSQPREIGGYEQCPAIEAGPEDVRP